MGRIAHAGATAPAEGQGAEDLKALDRLRDKRHLLGRQRRRREFPVVSMVGYTNCARGPSAPQDLVVHVRDVSRPETELQKASVPAALRGLRLPASLLDSVLEVHNKVDLVPGYSPAGSQAVAMSALLGHRLPELRARLEDAVLRATGRQVLTLRVRLAGAQLSWLYQEATVQDVDVIPDAGAANVRVVISSSAYSKFRKLFLESASQ
uniref:GTP binding protein 6 (putative) n=1 Tax=Felis catus TaxID=9685 RepID=A0ABI7VRG0_FELCA